MTTVFDLIQIHNETRNSATADKPRDAFVEMQWLSFVPPHMSYHVEFGRSALKDVGINTEPPKLGSAGKLRSVVMGDVDDPKIHAPRRHVLTRQIW